MRSFLPLLAVLALIGGCGQVGEVSGAVVRVQACEDVIATAEETTSAAKGLAGDPAKLRDALDAAADELDESAAQSGDTELNDAITGLADAYREMETDGDALRRVASSTAKYLQVITASCAAQ